MKVKIFPSLCHGKIKIPPSKSMSHRAIICASLAAGKSVIRNVAYSDDIKITIDGMKALGAKITCHDDYVVVNGIDHIQPIDSNVIFCKESGSTLRFFIPIFSLCNQTIQFHGENRLLKRPQKIYEDIFAEQKIPYIHNDDYIEIGGSLKSGKYTLDGNVSSQFISGLLFTLPLLEQDSTIHIKEPYESRSYVDLTLEMLHRFGIQASYTDANTLHIPGNQKYQACDYEIEGDYSHFGFFAVLASINNDLDIVGVRHDSKQGDRQIIQILKDFGVLVEYINNGYRIVSSPLTGSLIDLQNCPDLGPILNVLMMFSSDQSKMIHAERLRFKESDRILAMERELRSCGVDIHTSESEIIINGKPKHSYSCNHELSGHKDHRIVMSLSVMATIFDQPIIIQHAEFINKSYPKFFEDLKSVGIRLELIHE